MLFNAMARTKTEPRSAQRERPTLRELEVFRSVIACGKTTAAARQLGISQPAVSRALCQLEARRGKTLFRRAGNRLAPTAEALALNRELDPMFEVLARLDPRSRSAGRDAPLRIFATATFSRYFLPALIADFIRTGKGCAIHFEIGSSPEAIEGVASGLADIGLTSSTISHAGIRLEPFRRARACCVMPAGHRLAGRHVVRAQDLEGEPFIALTRRFSSRSVIDRILREAGVNRRIVAETATAVTAMELVRRGLGLSILNPFPVYAGDDHAVVFRRFMPEIVHQSSFILPVTPPQPDARRFIDYVKDHQTDDRHSVAIRNR